MRLGELVNMKCNWIDLDNNLITVKCDSSFNTKSKKERQIPMNKIVHEILSNKLKSSTSDEYIFYKHPWYQTQ
jgi:integrase